MSTQFDTIIEPKIDAPLDVADILVRYLVQLGIEYVFGVPGGAIEPLYNALARSERKNGPRAIVARHETGAAFMADGYFYNSGKLGVCCATTGPGTTNLITGVSSALQNQIPMLVITAQTIQSNFGRGASQDSSCNGIDTVAMMNCCTKYSTSISHIDQFEHKLVAALRQTFIAPQGPVHISIPLNILRQTAPVIKPSFDLSELLTTPSMVDLNALDKFKTILSQSSKTVFVIGSNCNQSIDAILNIATVLQAQLVTTPHGKGLVNPYHPLYRGVVGFAGHQQAISTLLDPKVDTIVAIGTNLSEWATDGWNTELLLNNRLVHVSDNEFDFSRSPQAQLHVLGNLYSLFTLLYKKLHIKNPHHLVDVIHKQNKQGKHQKLKLYFSLDDQKKLDDTSIPIKPQRLMHELTEFFPENTFFLADSGNSMIWATHYLHPVKPASNDRKQHSGATVRASMEFASMGWAIGAAIGTALAKHNDPVVCITGDGSVLMSGQEITVAIQEKLPVIYVILNDSSLGMVKHGQQLANAESIGFELPRIDFAGMAHAMGIPAYVIRSPFDFKHLDVNTICKRVGPTVLDVRIDTDEVPPMASRIRDLGTTKI